MKTMRGVRCGLAVVGLMACGIAGARTVYVSPEGDDDNDGASWSSAVKDVGVAYALATNGATAEAPGEVMLAAGLYTLTNSIAMHPYMHVIGAADGETILSGDKGTPDYWFQNYAGNYGNVLQDGAVYLPDYPKNPVSFFSPYDPGFGNGPDSYEDTVHAFACETKDAPTNVFKNLTFVLFVKAAIWSEGASVEGLTVENCRFYGNNHMTWKGYKANAGAIDLRKGTATIKDCLFRYNGFGVRFDDASGADVARKSRVINCQFLANFVKTQYSIALSGAGGVVTKSNSLVDILDCTFYRCGVVEGNLLDKHVAAGAVAVGGLGPVGSVNVVSNCTFEGNFTIESLLSSAALLCTHGDTTHENLVEVMACSFVSNRCHIADTRETSAAILLGLVEDDGRSSRLIVRDSYFAYNLNTNAVSSSGEVKSASVFADGCRTGKSYATFLNCTIENNVSIAPNVTSADGRCPSTFVMQSSNKDAIINCLIRNNDVWVADKRRAPEFYRDGVYNSTDFNIVNTIMTHEAGDYKPFADPFVDQRGMILATCVIKNFTWGENFSKYTQRDCIADGCLITPVKPLSEVSLVLGELQTARGVTARGVMFGSTRWLRKGGTPVYRGMDNRFYMWNPTVQEQPWRCLDQHMDRFTDAEMEEVGVVHGVTPIVADAFGAARPEGAFSIGPFNSPREGTVLTIK